MTLHEYLQRDPDCRELGEGAVLAVAPLLKDPDPNPISHQLEVWADELAGRMPLPWSLHAAVDVLNQYLFQELGFRGDRETFDDPENALLPRVIARRKGLPISLAILWIEVARRLGFDAVGIALPGHFIAGLRLDVGNLYVDPFHGGKAVGEEEAARLVRRSTSGRARFDASMLEPVSHRAILARLVRNLHTRFARAQAWEEVLWTSSHLCLLDPADPQPHRDRAFLHLQRGEVMEALSDLQEAQRLGLQDGQISDLIERLKSR